MSEWISVKDRLPIQTQGVLVWAHGYASDYIEISVFQDNEFLIDNVTHWMPLPDPPKDDAILTES
jgi:hypothetical protein